MLKKVLALVTLVAAVGCGGGGNNSGINRDPIGDFLRSSQTAIENQNINGIDRLLSQDYLQDCATREDVLASYDDLFSDPTVDDVFVDILDVSNEQVDESQGFATFFVRERITVVSNGQESSSTSSGEVTLVREGNVWREFGDQQCIRTQTVRKYGVFGIPKK